MTALDHNRAKSMLAAKAGVPVAMIKQMAIWGNHSSTMFPDYFHALVDRFPAVDVIKDQEWLDKDFIPGVQARGAAILKVRGHSSAGSAANAVVDNVRLLSAGDCPIRC
jgi:malate dehydrogenase